MIVVNAQKHLEETRVETIAKDYLAERFAQRDYSVCEEGQAVFPGAPRREELTTVFDLSTVFSWDDMIDLMRYVEGDHDDKEEALSRDRRIRAEWDEGDMKTIHDIESMILSKNSAVAEEKREKREIQKKQVFLEIRGAAQAVFEDPKINKTTNLKQYPEWKRAELAQRLEGWFGCSLADFERPGGACDDCDDDEGLCAGCPHEEHKTYNKFAALGTLGGITRFIGNIRPREGNPYEEMKGSVEENILSRGPEYGRERYERIQKYWEEDSKERK